jgi:hypothetical protein
VLRAVLARFGSSRALLRALPIVSSKFDSSGSSRLVELEANRAVVAFRAAEGHDVSRHDCLYTGGLLTECSALYGLPPASVHHTACQVDGAFECVFDVAWQSAPRSLSPSPPRRGTRRTSRPFGGGEPWLVGSRRGDTSPIVGRLMEAARTARSRSLERPPVAPELTSIYHSQLTELRQTLLELMETRDLDEPIVSVKASSLRASRRPNKPPSWSDWDAGSGRAFCIHRR